MWYKSEIDLGSMFFELLSMISIISLVPLGLCTRAVA
jgi:hypothetical protein